jgi:hypothetical protein
MIPIRVGYDQTAMGGAGGYGSAAAMQQAYSYGAAAMAGYGGAYSMPGYGAAAAATGGRPPASQVSHRPRIVFLF